MRKTIRNIYPCFICLVKKKNAISGGLLNQEKNVHNLYTELPAFEPWTSLYISFVNIMSK
jgi:hypothetical protein